MLFLRFVKVSIPIIMVNIFRKKEINIRGNPEIEANFRAMLPAQKPRIAYSYESAPISHKKSWWSGESDNPLSILAKY